MDSDLPARHAAFLERALPVLEADSRIAGVAAGGSFITGGMDEFSDLDLVIAVEPDHFDAVMADRRGIAAGLGHLLGAFTGEHVGEPRLLVCLYGPTALQIDLKFVAVEDLGERTEDPAILFERNDELSAAFTTDAAVPSSIDMQWIEDRFWIWIHYGAGKVGRGEILEAHDFLAFLRFQVLGPLALQARGAPPSGVRKIEVAAPEYAERLVATLGANDGPTCYAALQASAGLYLELRELLAPADLIRGRSAQVAALEYLAALRDD